ncbi:hypothetical protein [Acinetobacter gyllenbergii]|uniref:hypothetical protein n=1 Tax=Acinetobacter gyllenbergii TaxID=134534 RepID=UPI003F5648DB
MTLIRPDLFDFAKNSRLKSQFKGTKKIAKLSNTFFDETLISALNPQYLFDQLVYGKIDLELIQVFALMGWENNQWKSKNGKKAMYHLWLSALDKDQQGKSIFRHIMTLRVILADTERYPAPKDVIQTMRIGLENLIRSGEWKHLKNINILQSLITQNAKILAEIAFQQNKSVLQLIQEAGFPVKLPIVKDAEIYWLNLWVAANERQRQLLRQELKQVLTYSLPLEQQQKITKIILNSNALPKNVKDLEDKVKDFPELVTWLSSCAKNPDLILNFSHDEKQRLACWIGTGNYEALRKILITVVRSHSIDDVNKTANRYIFWKNYRTLFEESWLLLPEKIFNQNEIHLNNVKKIADYSYPVIVIRIMNKFIFQSFLGDASQNDLLMTDDIAQVEKLIYQDTIYYEQFKNLNLVLIHDHAFKWQVDLAYTLDKHFGICAKDKRVHYMEGKYNYSHYLQEVDKSEFTSERKQWKNLPRWVENNKNFHKYPENIFNQVAITAIRYGLVTLSNQEHIIREEKLHQLLSLE